MLTLLALSLLAQTQPAVRRTVPLSDDPGMVVRQVGTLPVNCTNCGVVVASDGGFLGVVTVDGGFLTANQGVGQDGGAWNVWIAGGNLNVSSSIAFDGGSIGYMQMPDGGALQVYVVNQGSSGGWVPDGGFIGSVSVTGPVGVNILDSGILPVSQSGNWVVTADLRDAGVNVLNFPAIQAVNIIDAGVLNANVSGSVGITGLVGVNIVDGGVVVLNTPTVVQGAGRDGGYDWGVWVTNPTATWFPDGGSIGSVDVANTVNVNILDSGVLSVAGNWWTGPDGGNLGYLRMPDGGPVEVYTTNSGSTSVVIPDGGLPVNVQGGVVSLVGTDVFGAAVMSTRYNQIEVDYSSTDPDAISTITVTKTNGGDAINSGGQAVYSTGTNATGGIKAVTNSTTIYRPHAETYAAFTAVFTTGVANSYQRVGIFDTNNGFYVGYEGTDFGLTLRKAGVNTFTPRASWTDPLTGGAGSKYTRNGVPEAMDPTKDQLWRIRYGWLGAAPVTYEILSPDGAWVTFYTYKHPNTNATTSINNPDLPITLDVQKTAGATDLIVSTACWAGGSTSDLVPIGGTINDGTLASMARSVITGRSSVGGGTYVNVKVNPSGALNVAATQDTFPWLVAGADGGALQVNGTWFPDGGSLGSVAQGLGQDGGAWNVSVNNWQPTWFPDGGTIGAVTQSGPWVVTADLRDASVVVTNFPASWFPDGGNLGTVTLPTKQMSNYVPDPADIVTDGGGAFMFDPSGNLAIRGQVTTDEGSFSDGFAYLAYPLTGTVTMTNGSTAVTGVGTVFTTELDTDKYIRLNADPQGSGRRIASVESDTSLTLEEPYAAAGGSGLAVASNWTSNLPVGSVATVDGGSFTVQNSGVAGDILSIYRQLDYGPIDLTFRLAVSARNATETIEVGLHNESPPNDTVHAAFEFTGTDNTVGFCKTSFSGAGSSNIQSFSIPEGGTTASQHLYSISLIQDRVSFFVDNVLVCVNQYNLPGPYTPLQYGLFITEDATTASPAVVTGTWAESYSYNRVDSIVRNSVPAKLQAQVQGPVRVGDPIGSTNPLIMGGYDGIGVRTLQLSPQGEVPIIGSLGSNSNPPANDNVGALTGVSTAANPSYLEGNMVALSTDLGGRLRTLTRQGASADGGVSWPVEVTNGMSVVIVDGGFNGVVTQGAGQDGGAWNVSVNNWAQTWFPDGGALGSVSITGPVGVNLLDAGVVVLNFPATQPVSGTVAATQSGTWAVNQGTGLDGGTGWGVWVENQVVPWAPDGGSIGLVSQGNGQDGGAWNVSVNNFPASQTVNGSVTVSGTVAATQSGTWSTVQGAGQDGGAWNVAGTVDAVQSGVWSVGVNNFPATQTVTGTVNATVAFDGGLVTAIQGPSRDGGWNWPVEVNNVVGVIILDGGASGGGGTVTQGPGQDGGAWAVYVTNPGGAASTVNQGLGYDGGGTWGVWIEGGNLAVTSSVVFDGGNIGYMIMPDGGPLEVALTSGTINIASVTQGPGQDGGAWNVAGTVSVANFPATQPVSGSVSITGTASTNLAQVNGNTVNVGSGAAGTGTQRVILATDQTSIPVTDNGGSITVDGTVAATQSGTWNINNISGTVSLPTGAATSANQTTLGSQTTKLNDGTDTALITAAGALVVDGSGSTQPVSGTVTANQGGTWSVRTQDGAGNALASSTTAPAGTEQALIVRNIPSGTQTVSGTVTVSQATAANLNATVTGTVTANAGTGTFQQNMAQYGGVAVGAGNAVHVQPGTGATFTVTQATAANLNATVTGTVAATQSGTWSTRTQDGSGNAIDSAVSSVNGANRGLIVRPVLKTATNMLASSVSCATTATALPATALTGRESLCVQNNGTGVIYLGGSGVTTATGFPLARGATYCDDLGSQVLFCIVGAGTENARVLEQ